MKVAIVGASGQLGRCTLDAVLAQGVAAEDVVAAVRSPEKLSDYAERGVVVRRADYDDPASLAGAFKGVERVLLTPSLESPGRRCLQYENAIGAARDGRCAYVSRADIGRAGAAALTTDGHEGKTYNLTGPEAITTAELCESVARVTGEVVVHRESTDQDYLQACLDGGTPEPFARLLLTLYWTIRDGHCNVATNDIEILTGQPAQSLEDFLRGRLS